MERQAETAGFLDMALHVAMSDRVITCQLPVKHVVLTFIVTPLLVLDCDRRQEIVSAGDSANKIFLIASGEVEILSDASGSTPGSSFDGGAREVSSSGLISGFEMEVGDAHDGDMFDVRVSDMAASPEGMWQQQCRGSWCDGWGWGVGAAELGCRCGALHAASGVAVLSGLSSKA